MEYFEIINKTDTSISEFIDSKFNEYANENGLVCNYNSFAFVAKDGEKIIGVITGHSYYNEVHISDFVVLKNYRGKGIGTNLIKKVELFHKYKGFKISILLPMNFRRLNFTDEIIMNWNL